MNLQLPNFYHYLWHCYEQEAIPHAAHIAAPLVKGFPQIHLTFLKSTFIASPKLKFFKTPYPKFLIVLT
jgi:hypothetical protein